MQYPLLGIILLFFSFPLFAQKTVIADAYEQQFKNNHLAIKRGIYWGFLDTLGNVVTPFTDEGLATGIMGESSYPTASSYALHRYTRFNRTLNDVSIFTNKNVPITTKLSNVGGFTDSLCVVQKNSSVYYINSTGAIVVKVPANCSKSVLKTFGVQDNVKLTEFFGDFYDGLAYATITDDSNKMFYTNYNGFITKKGTWAILPKYNQVNNFSEGRAVVSRKNANGEIKWGIINTQGKELSEFIYTNAPSRYKNGFAIFKNKERLFGFLNSTGQLAIPAKYKAVSSFEQGQALVWEQVAKETQFGAVEETQIKLIDTLGNTIKVLDGEYSVDMDYSGWLDKNVLLHERNNFEDAFFSEGLLACSKHLKQGALDKNGSEIIPFLFDTLRPFKNGRAFARQGEKAGFINPKGEWVFIFVKSKL